jgi:hypothetical protein
LALLQSLLQLGSQFGTHLLDRGAEVAGDDRGPVLHQVQVDLPVDLLRQQLPPLLRFLGG